MGVYNVFIEKSKIRKEHNGNSFEKEPQSEEEGERELVEEEEKQVEREQGIQGSIPWAWGRILGKTPWEMVSTCKEVKENAD